MQDELLAKAEKALKKLAPGALALLNTAAKRCCNKTYVELLAEMRLPAILSLLKSIYGEGPGLDAAICIFVARPLVEIFGLETKPRVLAKLILEERWEELYRLLGITPREEAVIRPQDYLEIFSCTYAAEIIAVRAYELLAKAVNDPLVAGTALYISKESEQHASVVLMLARELGLEVPEGFEEAVLRCSDVHVREYAELVKELERKLNEIKDSAVHVAEYFEKLVGLEHVAGEERYSRTMFPLITLLFTDERREIVSSLVELIISDEKYHEELAKSIAKYLRSINTS